MKCTECKICYYLIVIKKEKNKKIIFLYQGGYIMKLSRNVLVGSLATVGMVLGSLAPAVVAQAATTTGSVDGEGNVTRTDKTEIGALPGNDKLAIAYNSSDTATDGEATAQSNASVKVISGVLVLNQVPDFNFGTAVSGQTKDLVDNTKNSTATAVDGNSQGYLSVLESRDTSKAQGFTLQAALGDFLDADGNKAGTSAFTMNLLPQPITNGQTVIDNGTKGDLTTEAAPLESGDATGAEVMNLSQGDKGYQQGEYLAKFNGPTEENDNKAGATLKIADGIGDGSKAQVKSLNSVITWTLKAKANTTPAG